MEEIKTIPRDEKGRVMKGYSLNPKGRQKKGLTLAENISKALEEKVNGNPSKLDNIINELVKKAEDGDTKAIEILLDRGYGKAKAFLEITAKQEFEVDWGDDIEDDSDDPNIIDAVALDVEAGNEENTYSDS